MENFPVFVLSIVVFIIGLFFIYYSSEKSDGHVKKLTNITDLYSQFTPYMKDYAFSYLKPANCNPQMYYYDNNSVCFICEDIIPCFKYAWVMRTGGEKMNPKGVYLYGKYDLKTKLNFLSFGIADLLNCECDEKTQECLCDKGIKATLNNPLGFNEPVFIFPKNLNVTEEIENIARMKGESSCKFVNPVEIECGELKITLLTNFGNNVVMFE